MHYNNKILITLASLLFSQIVLAETFPDTTTIVNNSTYAFTIYNELNGVTYYLSAKDILVTPLKNNNNTQFTTSIYITPYGEITSPENSIPFFTGVNYNVQDHGWRSFVPDNFPKNYFKLINEEMSIYCDKTEKDSCRFKWSPVGGWLNNKLTYFLATINVD